jgi:hypothetical protein
MLACPLGMLRMSIPDFFTSDVLGVEVYRVDDVDGALVEAGRIEFLGIDNLPRGEQLRYHQLAPDGAVAFGPLHTPLARIGEEGVEISITFLNELPPGWFKVASYNEDGTSEPSLAQAYLQLGGEG